MGRLNLLLALFVVFHAVQAQTFSTGDNSSVADCTHHCSHHDESRFCLDGNAHFYERILMGQLRYYIATQVGISLWQKNHKGEARTKAEIHDDVHEGLGLQWKGEKDIVTEKIIDEMTTLITERVEEINFQNRTHAPPSHCPIPCEYACDTNRIALALSIALNAALAATLIFIVSCQSNRRNRHLVSTDEH